jgi:hypothetical protein
MLWPEMIGSYLTFFSKDTKRVQFELYKKCVREGFIKVMDWWKEVELVELFSEAAYSGQWRMLDNLYNNKY